MSCHSVLEPQAKHNLGMLLSVAVVLRLMGLMWGVGVVDRLLVMFGIEYGFSTCCLLAHEMIFPPCL